MRFGIERLGMDWMESSSLSTAHLKLTKEQLKAFGEEYQELLATLTAKYRGQETPGARRTQIQFNAFPLIDEAAEETPDAGGDA
jgi:hypothetical protein